MPHSGPPLPNRPPPHHLLPPLCCVHPSRLPRSGQGRPLAGARCCHRCWPSSCSCPRRTQTRKMSLGLPRRQLFCACPCPPAARSSIEAKPRLMGLKTGRRCGGVPAGRGGGGATRYDMAMAMLIRTLEIPPLVEGVQYSYVAFSSQMAVCPPLFVASSGFVRNGYKIVHVHMFNAFYANTCVFMTMYTYNIEAGSS